jgi:DNA-binding beta-propeller fold protein YncE
MPRYFSQLFTGLHWPAQDKKGSGERRDSMTILVRISVMALSFMIANSILDSDAYAQVFSFKWGSQGNGDGQFDRPVGIAIDSSGNVYVTDQNNNRVQKFDRDGNFLTKWGSFGNLDGQFSAPRGIAIDFDDFVSVADWGNNRIQKFDSSGNFITKWGSTGNDSGEFNNPYGIATDSGAYAYVTDFFNDRVQKFNTVGLPLLKWGSTGNGDGQFNNPRAIAVDFFDDIYVSDASDRVQKFDTSGNFLSSWGTAGTGNGQFLDPMGIAFESSGDDFISDWGNSRVQKFSSDGAFITKWGIFGSADGQFRWPNGVAVDRTGRVYVVDTENHRVQVFIPPLPAARNGTGNWLYSWSNNQIIDQVGVICQPKPDETGTATVSQKGAYITIVTSSGYTFTGFVSGSDVNASTSYFESGGVSSGELIFTLSSDTSGSGSLRYAWTDNVGSYCTGEADLTVTKIIPTPEGGGGGGGGGCFIEALFNSSGLPKRTFERGSKDYLH